MTAGLSLGAPGIYRSPTPPPPPAVQPIRLDASGFVGISWRGPAQEPVAVTSWSQFVEVFGEETDGEGRSCPGYLPRAVRAFFDQGGRTAWVCRVTPVTPDEAATARFALPGLGAALVAADEGSWGARLQLTLTYQSGPPLPRPRGNASPALASAADDEVVLADVPVLPAGSLLAVSPSSADPTGTLHWVVSQTLRQAPAGGRVRVLRVDPPLPATARGPDGAVDARVVTATLGVLDGDPVHRRSEQITGLGLHPDHPRYPARPLPPDHPRHPGPLLAAESRLVRTADGWQDPIPPADASLPGVTAQLVHGGLDRFGEIDVRSFFDDDSPGGDPLDERQDHRGVDRVSRVEELGLLCVPDLTWSGAATDHLEPGDPASLTVIARRQQALVAVAEFRHRFVALLDAPSRLAVSELTRWRADFDSDYAATYYPWLGAPGLPPDRRAVRIPPSAVAAGVIAARERRLGLPWGPANEFAVGVVTTDDAVPDAVHDELHRLGINVFRAERDGFRLTSARTLSLDPRYRQLSVRRLLTMITLAVERQAQWLVFEPNSTDLRATLFHTLTQFLRDLHRRGAFASDTEEGSFFVRCDDRLNPAPSQALGRLIAEIGVAPSSPLEYLVLRINQDTDGGLSVTPAAVAAAGPPAATGPGGLP